MSVLLENNPVTNGKTREIVSKSYLKYDDAEEERYIKLFCELKDDGYIVSTSYYEDLWILLDRYKDLRYRIDFSGRRLKKECKAFSVCVMKEVQPATASTCLNFIIKILQETDDLQAGSLDCQNLNVYTRYVADVFSRFIWFISADPQTVRIYLEAIEEHMPDEDYKNRSLPAFQSVILFDRIIGKFQREDLQGMKEFYPIVLWWKLTMIIPIRPIEFFILKDKDFFKEGDAWYIHITRCLKSRRGGSIPLVDKFRISQEVYNLFEEYIQSVAIGTEGYIFNSYGHDIANPREFMGRGILENMLGTFFKKVVAERYGYEVLEKGSTDILRKGEIERINYGDTRHLAFLNLIVSGFNPYTIAQLGGHRSLSAQTAYYSCLTAFCTSKAYALAYGIIELDSLDSFAITDWRSNQSKRRSADLTNARRIGSGYCISEDFPFECATSDCEDGGCPFFISGDSSRMNQQKENIRRDIERKSEILRSVLYCESEDSVTREKAANGLREDIIRLARILENEKIKENENG